MGGLGVQILVTSLDDVLFSAGPHLCFPQRVPAQPEGAVSARFSPDTLAHVRASAAPAVAGMAGGAGRRSLASSRKRSGFSSGAGSFEAPGAPSAHAHSSRRLGSETKGLSGESHVAGGPARVSAGVHVRVLSVPARRRGSFAPIFEDRRGLGVGSRHIRSQSFGQVADTHGVGPFLRLSIFRESLSLSGARLGSTHP